MIFHVVRPQPQATVLGGLLQLKIKEQGSVGIMGKDGETMAFHTVLSYESSVYEQHHNPFKFSE